MWRPTHEGRSTQMEERVTADEKKRWRSDDHDDEEGNVDSGFLSSGNLQFSGEIRDSGLQQQGGQPGEEGEGEQRAAPTPAPAVMTTTASSSTSSTTTIAEEPMRAIDSGVDLDLTDTLSQLSLKQVSLNALASKNGKLIQAESASPELSPVTANLTQPDDSSEQQHDEASLLEQHQRDSDERETSNEEPWQLYYTQDDDGDTLVNVSYFIDDVC